jgi:hypothetical protein
MYEKQTQSRCGRNLRKEFDRLFGSEEAYELIFSKHFKRSYKGKPTRRF